MQPATPLFDFEKMVTHSLDVISSTDRSGYILYVSNACKETFGYDIEEVIGRHFTDFIHPEDVQSTFEAIQEVFEVKKKINFVSRYLHKAGHSVPMRWSSAWSEEDETIYSVGRDISEEQAAESRLEESEQRYRALFYNSPDIVFVENKQGLITHVNKQFVKAMGISEENAIGYAATQVLPPAMASINEMHLVQASQGNSMRFDVELEVNGETRIYDTLKHPVYLNNEVVCIQTIAKDVTPIVHSYETIQRQRNKLNTIFESITDAFFTLDRDWKITYLNSEAERLLRLNRVHHIGVSILDIFPDEIGGEFYTQYMYAFETGKAVHFTSWLKDFDIWFRVKAFPSAEGLSVYFDDVTEQVKSSLELEKLSLVASKTTHGVLITDKERKIEWVNDGFSRLTGYSLEEVKGKIPSEFLHNSKITTKAFEAVKGKMLKGKPVSFDILLNRKDGQTRWLTVQVNPIYNAEGNLVRYVTIQTDITDKIEHQKELKKLSLVASKTNNGVLILNKDWEIEWVNDGFTRLMGYSMEEAVGNRPSEFLHSSKTDSTAFALLEEKLYQGEPITFDILNSKKSGEEVWLNVEITSTFDADGALSGFLEVQRDITALKRSEKELSILAKDLYKQNSDLQQFTYIVSHNLRAPVANAVGLSDILTRLPKDTELYNLSLSNLRQSVLKLDTVLKDMNTILSIRDSKGNLELEQVNIHGILQQAIESLQEPLEKTGGILISDISESLYAKANKAYLYSIFYNLLSNAIKYRCSERPLIVRVKCIENTEKGILISFSDNGSGFDMNKAGNNVFRLYKRFHTDRAGRGIGLYLVKSHLEAVGGHVEVESQIGVGTKFLISLPNV